MAEPGSHPKLLGPLVRILEHAHPAAADYFVFGPPALTLLKPLDMGAREPHSVLMKF